jgi:hypothetical protein
MGEWEQGLAEKHLISHTQLIIKLARAKDCFIHALLRSLNEGL